MGTGWRRAFCNTATRDSRKDSVNDAETATTMDKHQQQSSSSSPRLSRTNPNTPRLRCNTSADPDHHRKNSSNFSAIYNLVSPKLQCKTTPKSHSHSKSPTSVVGSYPSSPRSPFSILKNTLRSSSKNSCGACMQSVKTGQRTPIYTAECSHSFHFPCIASHLKKQASLTCPVCNVTWKNAPLLFNGIHYSEKEEEKEKKTSGTIDCSRRQNITSSISPRFYQSKMFADDEPLLTPKASTPKFIVPIPEAPNEEFQGFLPDPTIHSNGDHSSDSSKNVEITVSPESALVSATTYTVVLKVKAPPPLPTRRAPIDLVAVLDTSPSMSGPKLHMLQRAMRLVISSLGSADRLSLLSFSATPKRLMPLTRMTGQGQRFARRVINQLSCGYAHGGSSMAQALKLASTVLEDRRERNPVATIILLSDNNHRDENVAYDDHPNNNNNNQRLGSSHVSSTRFSHVEIPVHSSSREDSEDAFSKCVGGLLSVVVQDLKINLDLACGSDPGEISAVYSAPNGRPTAHDTNCINLGNLYAEEERELLVEIRVPEGTTHLMPYSHRHHHVLSVRCCYKDPSTHELVRGPERTQIVPQQFKIERLRNVFIATRAVAEGRRLLEHDEANSAMRMLVSTRGLLLQSRPELAEDCLRMVEAELAEIEWKRKCRDQCRRQCGEAITSRTGGGGGNNKVGGYVRRGFDVVGDLHGFENARF